MFVHSASPKPASGQVGRKTHTDIMSQGMRRTERNSPHTGSLRGHTYYPVRLSSARPFRLGGPNEIH